MIRFHELLRRPKLIILAGIIGVIVLCWAWLAPAAVDMYGGMDGLSAWMMQDSWDARYITFIFLMWVVMMAGMMLPSAAPAILMFEKVVRQSPNPYRPVARSYAFVAGYLLIWTGFSAIATLLQWMLAEMALLDMMMEPTNRVFASCMLLLAGVWQFTPLKRTCLGKCRSPISFLSQHWKSGIWGALQLGIKHGLYCLGCCWALMLLLFFGGVMNLLWIAAITLFVLIEKLAPFGRWTCRICGVLLILGSVLLLLP
ncbi:DUF2182 domain-containing protein [Sinomicrobium weinanense]|uniref:DUF2182 domain-containing protein n=1 Tax=Sinomicrobium weinanense TaxID=2842200 RepID=A0A926JVK3_9FLAO|nr:DUF2182 domain-containing protein [Sinomicrobium weinanense]MBC9798166.1 DUF2182 domain-containing protein [Sinomicrobium weinanense]MBU3122130.1 DUF2182 domain-containing protein [Sinomicrobium weinanense]